MKFEDLYQDLLGDEYDSNDPIIIYMNNLKAQFNMNIKLKQLTSQKNERKSLSSESTESENSTEYGDYSSSQRSQISDYEEETDVSNSNNYQVSTDNSYKNKKSKTI